MATRKVLNSHPVTLTMSLPPLDESFELVTNNEPLEQWYYSNDGSFSPNRKRDNLVLTPSIKVTIPDTRQVVTPSIYNSGSGWWVMNADGTWPTDPITNQQEGNVDYIVDPITYSLIVKKNVLPDAPVVLKCKIIYIDPRVSGVLYEVEQLVTLNTNQDSETIYPDLFVDAPALQTFDPIFDTLDPLTGLVRDPFGDVCDFEFNAVAKWNDNDISKDMTFVWKFKDVEGGGSEETIENYPGYISGQGTATLQVNAMFAENFAVVCCAKFTYTPIRDATGQNPASNGWYVRTVTQVTNTTGMNPKQQGWYVLDGKFYVPTQDTSPQAGTIYYSITYSVTSDTTPQAGVVYYTTNGDLVPDKIYRTVAWELPEMNIQTVCGGSNVITPNGDGKNFTTTINSKGQTLTEEQKENFLFNWKRRQTNLNTINDEGWGPMLLLPNSKCFVSTKNTLNVKPDVYVKNAYRTVLCNGSVVTCNGDPVFARI